MKIFYFTSTGNALQICKELGGEHYSMVQVLKEGIREYNDDVIGIVFPCYVHDIPGPVKTFIKKMTLQADYIFAIMSYGCIDGASLNVVRSFTDKNGIHLNYLNHIVMVDNYIPNFDMDKQMDTLPGKEVEKNLAAIKIDIDNKKEYIKKANKFLGACMKPFISIMRKIEKANRGNFIIQDKCNLCGTCANVCPVDNITVDQNVNILDSCIGCFACTHNCPQNAIRLKGETSMARFRNKHASLKEIIDANR